MPPSPPTQGVGFFWPRIASNLGRSRRMTVVRRFVVVMALLFWQGGFLFYAAVVVPVGQEELESHRKQGFITRKVTNYLNLSGVVALSILGADVVLPGSALRGRLLRALAWVAMAGAQAALLWLHWRMDALLDPVGRTVLDQHVFRADHRIYLWVSTGQWAFGLVYLLATLGTWRAADREGREPTIEKVSMEEDKTELDTKG
jgi:hypothetical protein